MPKIWTDTIETHRQAVQEAAIDATAELIAEHGLLSVTMSQIAEKAGIGRATLYKYFPDVEAVLRAWHERHVGRHLEQLAHARDQADGPRERLEAVLRTYALIAYESNRHHDTEIAALLHRGAHVTKAQQHLHTMVRDLVAEAAEAGELRGDIAPAELATYCLHALTAASALPSKAAVLRLVKLTLSGLTASR
ncbi:TetR/AcrR family transcriptional regulator [Mycolicibacterium arseniciresistens]|uniref:TetR family transcriptional regulator n=1 Tax=Mycolicibacterium arseniciresistens TaxID=3062257 RepID=A0ABT8U9X5_9MYCO|nr:TetR family transcriptional regulator [Mycolicibacterium arseniciresistens]MDO3634592.1 TetR family transcriptional regulator [Mycolicibacterium arseniciresistens]